MATMSGEIREMGRKANKSKSQPVRMSEESVRLARIAAGYTNESVNDYISRVVAENARTDIKRLHESLGVDAPSPDAPKPKGKPPKG